MTTSPKTRTERDTFGPIEVPADQLWGAQTQRSLQNFDISGERMPRELIHALALVKKAAARRQPRRSACSTTKKADAIVAAADEVHRRQARRRVPAGRLADRLAARRPT